MITVDVAHRSARILARRGALNADRSPQGRVGPRPGFAGNRIVFYPWANQRARWWRLGPTHFIFRAALGGQ